MSRVKRFTSSLASGYLLLGTNVAFTLASVPLALHYLSAEQFGLWALVMQVSGYLQLVDLGMSNSIARILIDHKDVPATGMYGAIIKTGTLVLAVQGAIIGLGGAVISIWLPDLFGVPAVFRRDFQILMALQCAMTGLLLAGRIAGHVLQAHQRYDAWNYCQILGMVAGYFLIWIGFALGWGLYSLLVGITASYFLIGLSSCLMVSAAGMLPPSGAWGKVNWKIFHELFSYGKEVFFLTLGWQLVNASQVMVVTRTLGLEAAAVWSIASKPFNLAQMAVNRLLDFSTAAFAEMIVRGEKERLLVRFRDLVTLSVSLAAWTGCALALCNPGFLTVWTKGRIAWNPWNDWLMALLVVVCSTTRCFHGLISISKEIRALKYVYPLEGAAFIGLSFLGAARWGISGIIVSAVLTNALFSGVYGLRRVETYFDLHQAGRVLRWLRNPGLCLLALGIVFGGLAWLGRGWSLYLRLGLNGVVALVLGAVLFWKFGLNRELRGEIWALVRKSRPGPR